MISIIVTLYNREKLLRIKDKNHSINDMEVYFNNFNNAGDFMINFLNYFPNLTKLSLGIRHTKRKKKSGEIEGFTYFNRWFCFSACKNNIHDACERLRKGESGESAFTVDL